jgi:hypothetical protein
MVTYCGNNLNHSSLVSGTHVLGTSYQCLRKGIYVGSKLPYDKAFDVNVSGPYAPVDPRRVYCGNANVVPAGYDRIGSPSNCLQTGVGVGKSQRAQMGPPSYAKFYALILFCWIAVGTALLVGKPSIVLAKKDDDKHRKVNVGKFILWFVGICSVLTLCLLIVR